MSRWLEGRTVVLIGGGSGIGLAVAERVIDAGGAVVLGGRTAARLEEAAARLGARASWGVVDTGDVDSIEAFLQPVERVDALMTTAASYVTGGIRELSEQDARSPVEAKLWGQYRVVRAALDRLASDASIVLMSGAASVRPVAAASAYVAANAAVEGLARGLAYELAPVRVNAVSPGTVDGSLWASRPAAARAAALDGYAEIAYLGRPATESEVADVVVHLLEATYVTGTTSFVDGGFALR